MTDAHFANFIAGIRKGEKLNAPVAVGNVAVTMLQLSNVAWEVNRELHLDHSGWKDPERSGSHEDWGREYENGLGAASLVNWHLEREGNGSCGIFCIVFRPGSVHCHEEDFFTSQFRPLRRAAWAACAASNSVPGSHAEPSPETGKPSPLQLGLASYTFRNFTRAQMIGFMKQLNVTDLNVKDTKDHLPMDPAEEAKALDRLRGGRHQASRCRRHLLPKG